jgi:hypothetical protein
MAENTGRAAPAMCQSTGHGGRTAPRTSSGTGAGRVMEGRRYSCETEPMEGTGGRDPPAPG